MQASSGVLAFGTGSCSLRVVSVACQHQVLAPTAAAALQPVQLLLQQQQQQSRRCLLHSSSSAGRQQACRVRCQAAAAEDAPAQDEASAAQQQQYRQQQRGQQQQQRQQQQQQRQYPQGPPASLVSTTWGVAERRAHLAALARAADSVDGLAAVWLRCRAAAGPAELTVLFNRLAAVCEPRSMSVKGWNNAKALLRELLIASEDRMALMAGPEFVYIIAALAKLRAAPDQAWLNRWLAVSRHKLALLSPPQLIMCARALCRLDMQPGDVRACIAFPAWMHNYLAALHPRLAGCSGFDLVKLVRSLADLGYKPARPFLADFAAAVEPKLSSLDSINLAGLMGGFSALKYEPEPAFMRAFYAEVYQKLPLFDDQDLATALCAFSSMRRLMKGNFLAEFLGEVAGKLPTFGLPALASVLGALGRLGYRPGEAWTEKVAAHLESRLWKANIHVLATCTWGLANCGHIPGAAFVEELLAASMPKLGHMEAAEAVMLGQALAKFGYRPNAVNSSNDSSIKVAQNAANVEGGAGASSSSRGTAQRQRTWNKWWERYCAALNSRSLHPKQVVTLLECFSACGVSPQPQTVDHLVLQLVQGGLQHAPVAGIAQLLSVLAATQHNPGLLFVKNYAYCIRLVATSLKAHQLSGTLRCLAQQGYKPAVWWLVHLLAVTHARVTEFEAPAASSMLWAAAKLSQHSQLPSDKWAADFAGQFWGQLTGLTAEQLADGMWGAVKVGYRPSEQQWEAWEAAAAAVGWQLPLQQARDAVEAMRAVQHRVPEPLLQQLQQQFEQQKAAREAEVAAAEAARQRAAAALAAQQQRAAAAAAAIAAHRAGAQQQQQQLGAASEFVAEVAQQRKGAAVGNSKGRRKKALRAAARGGKGPVLVLQSLGAAAGSSSGSGEGGGAAQATPALA